MYRLPYKKIKLNKLIKGERGKRLVAPTPRERGVLSREG